MKTPTKKKVRVVRKKSSKKVVSKKPTPSVEEPEFPEVDDSASLKDAENEIPPEFDVASDFEDSAEDTDDNDEDYQEASATIEADLFVPTEEAEIEEDPESIFDGKPFGMPAPVSTSQADLEMVRVRTIKTLHRPPVIGKWKWFDNYGKFKEGLVVEVPLFVASALVESKAVMMV